MSQSTSVMDRLARRAKWRRAWEKYRRLVFYVVLLLIAIPSLIAFTPWGPKKVHEYIVQENALDEPVEPWATEWLYRLGRFYQLTLRKREAEKIYEQLYFDWYLDHGKAMKIPDGEPWVGRGVFQLAQILNARNKKQVAHELFRDYAAEFADHPESDPEINRLTEAALRRYRAGG